MEFESYILPEFCTLQAFKHEAGATNDRIIFSINYNSSYIYFSMAWLGKEKLKIRRFLMPVAIAVKWTVSAIRLMIQNNNLESLEIAVVVCHIK